MTTLVIPEGARACARVIILDHEGRVLMLRAEDDHSSHHWWVMPGGGLREEESFESAALREVWEETGLHVDLGPCVWTRHHVWRSQAEGFNQYERFFVARSATSNVTPRSPDSYVRGFRWWTAKDIAASDEDFAPNQLAALLPPIVAGVFPNPPIDAGV